MYITIQTGLHGLYFIFSCPSLFQVWYFCKDTYKHLCGSTQRMVLWVNIGHGGSQRSWCANLPHPAIRISLTLGIKQTVYCVFAHIFKKVILLLEDHSAQENRYQFSVLGLVIDEHLMTWHDEIRHLRCQITTSKFWYGILYTIHSVRLI